MSDLNIKAYNNLVFTLAVDISDIATNLTVDEVIPAYVEANFYISIGDEILLVKEVDIGNKQLKQLERGIGETTASGHLAGALIINKYVAEAHDYLKDKIQETDYIDADLTLTIGASGDYTTINEALEYLSKRYPQYVAGNYDNQIKVKVKLLNDYVMSEQVHVKGIDLGWIVIEGNDTTPVVGETLQVYDRVYHVDLDTSGTNNSVPVNEQIEYNTLFVYDDAVVVNASNYNANRGTGRIQFNSDYSFTDPNAITVDYDTYEGTVVIGEPTVRKEYICANNNFKHGSLTVKIDGATQSERTDSRPTVGGAYYANYGIGTLEFKTVPTHPPTADYEYMQEVTIVRSALDGGITPDGFTSPAFPAFCAIENATIPVIGALFKMDDSGSSTDRHGILCVSNSSGVILPDCGVKNAGSDGLHVAQSSTINARSANMSCSIRHGMLANETSTINARLANASNAGENGIYVLSSSTINANSVNVSNSGVNSIHVTQFSTINARLANASNAGTHGVFSPEASMIEFLNGNASGAGERGVSVGQTSTINALGVNASNAGTYGIFATQSSTISTGSANASNAGEYGIYARASSTINAEQADASNAGGAYDIVCWAGSNIFVSDNIGQETIGTLNLTPNEVSAAGAGMIHQGARLP